MYEPHLVGDDYVPLLSTVFITGQHEQMINNAYVSPHYVPVNIDTFDTIETNIKSDLNETSHLKQAKSYVNYTSGRKHYEAICSQSKILSTSLSITSGFSIT